MVEKSNNIFDGILNDRTNVHLLSDLHLCSSVFFYKNRTKSGKYWMEALSKCSCEPIQCAGQCKAEVVNLSNNQTVARKGGRQCPPPTHGTVFVRGRSAENNSYVFILAMDDCVDPTQLDQTMSVLLGQIVSFTTSCPSVSKLFCLKREVINGLSCHLQHAVRILQNHLMYVIIFAKHANLDVGEMGTRAWHNQKRAFGCHLCGNVHSNRYYS